MSQHDPFREIVKTNSGLYRDSEDQRELMCKQRSLEMQQWRRCYEVYVRAAKCFAICEASDLTQIGIFDTHSLAKHVDMFNKAT